MKLLIKIFHIIQTEIRYFYYARIFRKVGKNVAFGSNITYCNPANITIGSNTLINHHTELLANKGKIYIGNFVLIAPNVFIAASSHNFKRIDIPIVKQGETGEDVVIEDNVWIGTRAVILPGITIGRDAIIGAGAVVTRNVPEFAVVGGVPAKIIKMRKNKNKK